MKKPLKLNSIYYYVFFFVALFLQNAVLGAFSYNLKNYGINEGLPSSQIYQIIQDKKGYIWFGTDRGLVKYNGSEFTIYTTKDGLTSNVIFHLYENDNGEMWCYGNDHRLHYFQNEQFWPFEYNDTIVKYYPKRADLLYFTAHKNEANISVVNFKASRHYFKINKDGLTFENSKGIFIKEIDKRITVSTNQVNDHIYYNDSLIYTFSPDKVLNNSPDKKLNPFCYTTKFESTLFITVYNRILKFDLKNKNKPILKEVQNKNIQNITSDSKGNVFVSHNKGVIWFENGNLNESHEFLKGYNVSNIFVDENDGLWIATLFNGIFRLSNIEHRHFLTNDKTKNIGLFEMDEEIYLELSSGELYNVSGGFIEKIKIPTLKNKAHLFFSPNYEFFDNSFYQNATFFNPVDHSYFKSEYESYKSISNDTLLISLTTNTHLEIESNLDRFSELKFDRFINNFTFINDLVFVSTDNSIRYFQIQDIPTEKELISITTDSLNEFHPEIPFFQSQITDIRNINDEIILFSSVGKGLCIYNFIDDTYKIYTKKDGLVSNTINQTYYKDSTVIAVSRKGFSLIRDKSVQNYSTSNGLISNNIVNVILKKDTLWVSTDQGVSIIPIGSTKIEKPKIHLNLLTIDGISQKIQKKYDLSYTAKNLDIVFESISFYEENQCDYQYTMEGLDENWVETKSNHIRYPNLPSGNFRLLIRKEQADKTWSEPIELFSIAKPIPYWKKSGSYF